MARIVLIIGGVRSGKSRFAQDLAHKLSADNVLFVATAEAGDDEMIRRIQIHQAARPGTWTTLEAAQNIGARMQQTQQSAKPCHTIVIDCLTLLVSNVLQSCGDKSVPSIAEQRVGEEIKSLLSTCELLNGTVIIVSGEVGLGVVPESALGRQFRDLLGRANQAVAARSNATYLMVAGLPIELKSLAVSIDQAASTKELQK
jgi:adenosylcobinamide kinase/adenosylcobinamide-phosphate guanylyltransferase